MPSRNTFRRYRILGVATACLLLCGFSLFLYLKADQPLQPQRIFESDKKENLYLYVPGEEGGLQKKTLEVRPTLSEKARADLIFQELRRARAIPASCRLQELAFGEGGVLYLDVSQAAIGQQPDARDEIRTVFSLVNSFIASYRDISRVQLLVDGRPLYTFSGVVYTFMPLSFNNDLQED